MIEAVNLTKIYNQGKKYQVEAVTDANLNSGKRSHNGVGWTKRMWQNYIDEHDRTTSNSNQRQSNN